MSDFEVIGGAKALQAIVDDFVDLVFEDVMIGFHFRNADRDRVKKMEYQLAARLLGADIAYEGRPLREVHAPHGIMGGQFMRRQVLLKQALDEHGAPSEITDRWLAHNESLRPLITSDAGSDCDQAANPPERDVESS